MNQALSKSTRLALALDHIEASLESFERWGAWTLDDEALSDFALIQYENRSGNIGQRFDALEEWKTAQAKRLMEAE